MTLWWKLKIGNHYSKLARIKLKVKDTWTQGFGFSGYCPNAFNGLDSLLTGNAKKIYENYLLPILTVFNRNMQICLGDSLWAK